MTLTNNDILTYILNNRIHYEDGVYLLQEKVESMGNDAIGSARAWLFGRFLHAGETEIFEAFISMTYDDLIPADLTELEAIREAFYTATGSDKQKTSIYMMLFESLIRLSIAYLWKAAGMEGEAGPEEKNAQQLISAIVGAYGNPQNILGEETGADMENAALESVVKTYNLTDDEIKAITGNYF